MLKHMQDPVPSILGERKDLPPAVGQVIARAMAKLPSDRYQTVGELVEDLTIAGGMTGGQAPAPEAAAAGSIIQDDADEITVVRPREVPQPEVRRPPVQIPFPQPVPVPDAGASTLNPLKIIIPSAIALIVIFAGFYVFTRTSNISGTNSNQPIPNLTVDPNSRPVEVASPPTGRDEEGIPSGGTTSPPANVNANTNVNANVQSSPTATEEFNPSPAVNENSNANSKAPPLPSPTRAVTPEDVPGPPPPGTKSPVPKSSPPVPTPSVPSA
jgi:hypothetical protein